MSVYQSGTESGNFGGGRRKKDCGKTRKNPGEKTPSRMNPQAVTIGGKGNREKKGGQRCGGT